MTKPIDVIIADDHTVVRDGIRAVLQREGGEFRVVAEAADVPSMIRADGPWFSGRVLVMRGR